MDIDFFDSKVYNMEQYYHFGPNVVPYTPTKESEYFTYHPPNLVTIEETFIQIMPKRITLKNYVVKTAKKDKPINPKIQMLIQ